MCMRMSSPAIYVASLPCVISPPHVISTPHVTHRRTRCSSSSTSRSCRVRRLAALRWLSSAASHSRRRASYCRLASSSGLSCSTYSSTTGTGKEAHWDGCLLWPVAAGGGHPTAGWPRLQGPHAQHTAVQLGQVRRLTEMAVFCGQSQQAEGILLQAGLVFRALMLNIQLYNWDR